MKKIIVKDGDLVLANGILYSKRGYMKDVTKTERELFVCGVSYAIKCLRKKGHDI